MTIIIYPFFITIIVHLHCVLFCMIFCVMLILSLLVLSKIGPCFRLYLSNNEKWNYLDSIHIFIKWNKNWSNWEWMWCQCSIVVRILLRFLQILTLLYVSASFSNHGPCDDEHPLYLVPWSVVSHRPGDRFCIHHWYPPFSFIFFSSEILSFLFLTPYSILLHPL